MSNRPNDGQRRWSRLLAKDSFVGQFLRYLVVGGVAFVADFGTLVALTDLAGLWYLASAAVAFCCGLAVNYVLSIRWVFNVRAISNWKAEFATFAAIGLIGLGWTELLMFLGTDVLSFHYKTSKLITTVIVLLWNFGARKLLLFVEPKRPTTESSIAERREKRAEAACP